MGLTGRSNVVTGIGRSRTLVRMSIERLMGSGPLRNTPRESTHSGLFWLTGVEAHWAYASQASSIASTRGRRPSTRLTCSTMSLAACARLLLVAWVSPTLDSRLADDRRDALVSGAVRRAWTGYRAWNGCSTPRRRTRRRTLDADASLTDDLVRRAESWYARKTNLNDGMSARSGLSFLCRSSSSELASHRLQNRKTLSSKSSAACSARA